MWQGFYLTCPTLPHLTFAGVAMPLTDVERAAEEREAQRQLAPQRAVAKTGRRQVFYDWPWQIPQRPAAPKPQPPPVVDIVALAKAELAKETRMALMNNIGGMAVSLAAGNVLPTAHTATRRFFMARTNLRKKRCPKPVN